MIIHHKERCKTTINLIPEAELLNVLDEASETKALMDRKRVRNVVRRWIAISSTHIVNYIFVVTIRIVMVIWLNKANSKLKAMMVRL